MNFQRLLIVVPVYAATILLLEQSALIGLIQQTRFEMWQVWTLEFGAFVLGVGGAWLLYKPELVGGQNHPVLFHLLGTAAIGLFFSSVFGLFNLMQDRFPYIPNLVILPLAFVIAEAIYIGIMRAIAWRKRRQDEDRNLL